MDDPRTDLILKELKRIKWLLVIIAIGLLALPASLVYVGWEIASVILQERMGDEPEEVIETAVDGSIQRDFTQDQVDQNGSSISAASLPDNVRGKHSPR